MRSELVETKYDIGETKERIRDLLAVRKPSALVCGNDVIAQGAVYACQSMAIRIPEDLSVIGIGDFQGSAHMEPGLTTWRLPARRIGHAAADYICTMSSFGADRKVHRTKIGSQIVERGSVCRKA